MTNTHSTKKALLMSAISLLLCFVMLLGTTFAWFTDSVTSANNIIASGNLDIELEYAIFNDDGSFKEWKTVQAASDILTNDLWEPGVTEVAYFRVANAGSLTLKYQLGINIISETAGKNVEGNEFLLSDYIMFGIVNDVNAETD
ncbi:MAG: SipW-dependent-type signal peptide-containing protein, partial [Clostridia bacterium]|nr:SipW-dependent-type signal peptide-containing protein [Clostridia bacterium]